MPHHQPFPINNAEWFPAMRDRGWTTMETLDSTEPNHYGGGGHLLMREFHMADENGNFAGVAVNEVFVDRQGELRSKWYFVPFILTAEDCL